MIPNIDLLTTEIPEAKYANRTYKLQVSDGVVHTDSELNEKSPLVIDDISPFKSKLDVEICSSEEVSPTDITLVASHEDDSGVVYYTPNANGIVKNVNSIIPATKLSTYQNVRTSAIGETVEITDISPVEHPVEVSVHSKNLFNAEIIPDFNWDSVSAAHFAFTWAVEGTDILKILKPNTTYTISYCAEVLDDFVFPYQWNLGFILEDKRIEVSNYTYVGFIFRKGNISSGTVYKIKATFKTPDDLESNVQNYRLRLSVPSGVNSDGNFVTSTVKFTEIQIEEGKVATPYTEWFDPTLITLTDANGETHVPDEYSMVNDITYHNLSEGVFSTDTSNAIISIKYNTFVNRPMSLKVKYVKASPVERVRVNGYIDDVDALKQTIYYILSIERYQHIIYSWDYGVELTELFGKQMTYVIAEIPRRITEALTQDNRIDDVQDFQFEVNGKRLHTTFTVISNSNTFSVDWEVEI